MILFLKIVLAVIVVIALLVVVGFWALKRWIRRLGKSYATAAELIDPRRTRPARLQLKPAAANEIPEPLQDLWTTLHGLGFRRLGDFEDQREDLTVRAARHPSGPFLAALTAWGDEASFTLFAVTRDKRFIALSSEPDSDAEAARLSWRSDSGLSPEEALERLRAMLADAELLDLDPRAFRAAWEQAYLVRADQFLAGKPTREQIAREASARNAAATEADIDRASRIVLEHWREQVDVAALDRYRRDSRIDAVRWEAIEDDVQVVHAQLEPEQIESLLVGGELEAGIFQQCVAQGYQGIQLYEQVMQRLPEGRRREKLGEVSRPLRAVIYGPCEQGTAVASGQFLYQATGTDGEQVDGAVIAQSSRDAKQQLVNMGLRDIKLVVEPNPLSSEPVEQWLDPETAALAARIGQESLPKAVLRALWGNKWVWVPPALLLIWTAWDGAPLDWVDYLIIVYAVGALAFMFFAVAPMVLYDQLLRARLTARWGSARFCIAALKRVSLFGGLPKGTLEVEKAKVLAAEGKVERALALWRAQEPAMEASQYRMGLAQIYDAAGDHTRLIETQRSVLAATAVKETATVDLAMSLARYGDVEEAKTLLAKVSPGDLSELAMAGYHFARGLIAARMGQNDWAVRHYGQAIEQIQMYRNNPLVVGVIAEINAYAAVALKRLGERQRADALWQQVWPVLRVHRGSAVLAGQYEAA